MFFKLDDYLGGEKLNSKLFDGVIFRLQVVATRWSALGTQNGPVWSCEMGCRLKFVLKNAECKMNWL